MDMDYNEIFGIDEPGVSSELEVEDNTATSDAEDDADSEAKDSDSAVTDDSDEDASSTVYDGPPSPKSGKALGTDDSDDFDDDDTTQSSEENKKYAAARRKAEKERDIAVKKAREDARAEAQADADKYIDDAIKAMNLKNPYTGKLIETKAELEEYKKSAADSRKDEFLRRSGMSEEEYRSFVENLPEVAQARLEKEKLEKARIEADRNRAAAKLGEEIKLISKLDPTVKSVEDITKSENYPEIYERVKRGYSLYDAYLSVNHARLGERSAATARQKALNDMSSKEHLTASSQRGKGMVSVPKDVADVYREFNPKATDAEIIKHYNRYINGKR